MVLFWARLRWAEFREFWWRIPDGPVRLSVWPFFQIFWCLQYSYINYIPHMTISSTLFILIIDQTQLIHQHSSPVSPIQFLSFIIIRRMIDNFFQQGYHSFDLVYTDAVNSNSIYIGDAQSALDGDFHLRQKIRTVVTAAQNMDHIIVGTGINHIVYPLLDGKHENIAIFFDRFYSLVEASIKKGNLLVHCAAGISRSATLVISYLMRKQNWSFREAIAFVRKSRPSVLPNLGFQRQLKKYEQRLKSLAGKNSRNSRRSQVRTSQSGKSDASGRGQLLPIVAPFPFLKQEAEGRHFLQNFSQKDIQILKIYNNGRKNVVRNRIIHNNKTKNPLYPQKRMIRTEECEQKDDPFFRIFKLRDKDVRSRIAGEEKGPNQQKKTDLFVRKLPTERGHTTDNLKNRVRE